MLVDRYRPILFIQYLLLLEDLILNSFSILARFQNVVLLVLYVIQDACLLLAVIVLFLVFFNTYIFQAGLVNILINKFKLTIFVVFVYLGLCIGLNAWGLTMIWNDPYVYIYSPGYIVLFVLQRLAAVLYYYSYKRTVLILSHPKFYENSDWLQKEFYKKH